MLMAVGRKALRYFDNSEQASDWRYNSLMKKILSVVFNDLHFIKSLCLNNSLQKFYTGFFISLFGYLKSVAQMPILL